MLTGLLLALTACADSIQSSTEAPRLNDAPAALTQDCSRPVRIPDRELTQAEVEELWLRDREALIACGLNRAALQEFYENRDALLRGS